MNYQPPQPGGGAPPPGGPPCACGYFPAGQFCEQCGAPNQNFQGGGQPPFPPSPGGFDQGQQPGGYPQGGQPPFPPPGGYDQGQQPPFAPGGGYEHGAPGGSDPYGHSQPGGYDQGQQYPPSQDPYGQQGGGYQPSQPPFPPGPADPYGQQGGGYDPNQAAPGGYQPSQPPFQPGGYDQGQGGYPGQADPYGQQGGGYDPNQPASGAPAAYMSAPPTSAPPHMPPGVPSAPFQPGQPMSAPPGPPQQMPGYSIPDASPNDPAAAFPPPGQAPGQPGGGHGGTGLQWVLVATADRAFFGKVAASEEGSQLEFPAHYQPRRFPLDQGQVNIGRYNARRGTAPEIDLSGEASDPGVSSQHASLQAAPDGTWILTDTGSSNGTFLNGGDDPVPPHTQLPLGDGSYFHVGAWTRLTLHYEG
ncbi:FHA domain-containing protein [Natronoglycomyces albus]|uniref:FHA domain-containing protein n=1 Tax=Natronoglycomyces albus TaxID=2811108 RepID=A0A895XRP3_9ACTN|nr:FHA domain-containing protein [Natronoglycomyces albus]QSB06372.1 FHA domain-containing protein [Natronoglycomyces albus]